MRTTMGSIALAVAVAGAVPGCTGPEITEGAPCNLLLVARDGMPDLEMQVGDTVESPLRDHFAPDYCLGMDLTDMYGDMFETGSSDPAAVAVSVSGSSVDQTLTTVALDVAESVRVTVRLNPYYGRRGVNAKPHEFLVRVGDSTGR